MDELKLKHCPPELKEIATQMINIFGMYKTTINGRKTIIIADDNKLLTTWRTTK